MSVGEAIAEREGCLYELEPRRCRSGGKDGSTESNMEGQIFV